MDKPLGAPYRPGGITAGTWTLPKKGMVKKTFDCAGN